jgi:hypothetical protein
MMTGLVAMYQKGAITADHLVAECLHRVDPENPALVLDSLPDEILMRMLDYVRKFREGKLVSNYRILSSVDQLTQHRLGLRKSNPQKELAVCRPEQIRIDQPACFQRSAASPNQACRGGRSPGRRH